MPRSTVSADATAGQSTNSEGPPALGPQPSRAPKKCPPPGANSQMSGELAQLMEEPPGGGNHGRKASANPTAEGHTHEPLGIDDHQAREVVRAGGFTIITDVPGTEARGGGWSRSGGSVHRGVLHPDEHVDEAAVQARVEDALGFTYAEVHSVYSTGGRIPDHLRGLRGRLDVRLLALSRSGADMALLARLMGVEYRTLKRALRRARDKEGATR